MLPLAFGLLLMVAGQNPDTNTKSHNARLTWNHLFNPRSYLDLTLGFDRVHSLLVPEPPAPRAAGAIGIGAHDGGAELAGAAEEVDHPRRSASICG